MKIATRHSDKSAYAAMGAVSLLVMCGISPAIGQQGFQFLPSVSISEIYDDNIFLTPDTEEKDMITRLTPTLEWVFDSVPVSWNIDYSIDAETYRDNSQLDDEVIRQNGTAGLEFDVDPKTVFSLEAGYLETQTPGELNLSTGLEKGRLNARRTFVSPALSYELSPSMSALLEYTSTKDHLSGGVETERQQSDVSVERQLGKPTVLSAGFSHRKYSFMEKSGQENTIPDTELLWLGVEHDFSPAVNILLKAGSRKISSSTKPYLSFSLTRDYADGAFGFDYLKDETTLIGEQGRREIETAGIRFEHRIGNNFQLDLSPSYGTVSRSLGDSEVYRFAFNTRYRISNRFYFTTSWRYSSQDEVFSDSFERNVSRNVVMLGITFTQSVAPRNNN